MIPGPAIQIDGSHDSLSLATILHKQLDSEDYNEKINHYVLKRTVCSLINSEPDLN